MISTFLNQVTTICSILSRFSHVWMIIKKHYFMTNYDIKDKNDPTQMFSAASVGVLLHPNSNRKLHILWKKKTYLYINLCIWTYFPTPLQTVI